MLICETSCLVIFLFKILDDVTHQMFGKGALNAI